MVPMVWYHLVPVPLVRMPIHYLKNDLKYKHTGAMGKLPWYTCTILVVGVVSIDITAYYQVVRYYNHSTFESYICTYQLVWPH